MHVLTHLRNGGRQHVSGRLHQGTSLQAVELQSGKWLNNSDSGPKITTQVSQVLELAFVYARL